MRFTLVLLLGFAAISSSLSTPVAQFATPLAGLSPEIVDELKDFADLIPTVTVDEIVAKYYLIDGRFRVALKFLRSAAFKRLLQQLQQIPEVTAILDYLHISDNATRALEGGWRSTPIDFVLVENEIAGALPERAAYTLATFTSFVQELLTHLPHDQYVQMINEKRQRSAAFAQFYAALRSAPLRPIVEGAMKSANLVAPISELSANDVDVKSLEPIAFNVISWGPAP